MNSIIPEQCAIEPLNPELHRGQSVEQNRREWTTERVIAGVLPVLSSFSVLQAPVNVISTIFVGKARLNNLAGAMQGNNGWVIAARALQAAAFIAVVIVTSIARARGAALAIMVSAAQSLASLFYSILRGNLAEALAAMGPVLASAIQCVALFYGAGLLWTVLSGVVQTLMDLVAARAEFQYGGWYEGLMLAIAGLLRAYSIAGPTERLVRDITSKKANREQLQAIVEKTKQCVLFREEANVQRESNGFTTSSEKIFPKANLDQELRRGGFSWRLSQLDLSGLDFADLSLEGVLFEGCGLESASFERTSLSYTEFQDCQLAEATFNQSKLSDVRFVGSDLQGASFAGASMVRTAFEASWCALTNFAHAEMRDVEFRGCQLAYSNFGHTLQQRVKYFQSGLTNTNFSQSRLEDVDIIFSEFTDALVNDAILERVSIRGSDLSETCFLGTQVQEGLIDHCSGRDVLFCDTEDLWTIQASRLERTARPVIAMSWSPQQPLTFGNMGYQALRQGGAVVLRFDMEGVGINPSVLSQEIHSELKRIDIQGLEAGNLSRGQQIVSQAPGIETARLVEQARRIMRHSDGLFLPGGSDIEPELYGDIRAPGTYCSATWNRSILEMALLQEAAIQDRAVLGICRGHQMINVFQGGSLNQNARNFIGAGHAVEVNSGLSSAARDHLDEWGMRGDSFDVYSSHHQAVNKIGHGLEVACTGERLVKGVVSSDGRMLGVQFHPELSTRIDCDELYYLNWVLELKQYPLKALQWFPEILSGRFAMPPFGQVEASGLSAEELQRELRLRIQSHLHSVSVWRGIMNGFVEQSARRSSRSREYSLMAAASA